MNLHHMALVCVLASLPIYAVAEVSVEPDAHNLVANHLEGKWQIETTLTKRLGGAIEQSRTAIAFRSDPTAVKEFSSSLRDTVEKQRLRIYLVGYMTYRGKDVPFALTTLHGNMVVFGDIGDAAVTIVTAKDHRNDLLFFAEGYEDKEPFIAYARADLKAGK